MLARRLPWVASDAGAVQEALHERQKGDEFLVLALLEVLGIAIELAQHLPPGIVGADASQAFPMPIDLPLRLAALLRHELQRPQHELPHVAHDGDVACVARSRDV